MSKYTTEDFENKLTNDIYTELGVASKQTHEAVEYLNRHGWLRTPEEAEAAVRGEAPGRTFKPRVTVSEVTDEAGTAHAALVIRCIEYMDLATVVPDEETTNAGHDRDWWIENANVNDAEDCEACEGDLCPVHYGISMGIDLMARKIAALGDDPELFALIPDPVKAPGCDHE